MDLPCEIVAAGVSDDVLGGVVRRMLAASPMTEEFRRFEAAGRMLRGERLPPGKTLSFDLDQDKKLATLFGLSSTKSLYSGAKHIAIFRRGTGVKFIPTWRGGRADFNFYRRELPSTQPARVRLPASDAELGAAARDAIARSSG